MKLSKEEMAMVDLLQKKHKQVSMLMYEDVTFLFECIDKINLTSKPQRFTYEMKACKECGGGKDDAGSLWTPCNVCGGLDKIRTKVARK